MLCAALVATLVALSATFRDGARAWLYVVLATFAGPLVALPYVFFGTRGLALTYALGLVVAFLALRAFGETLARYDPLPAL
jgi:VIT1/CCC1 family predicted Fe2+/Mn2+ transporter